MRNKKALLLLPLIGTAASLLVGCGQNSKFKYEDLDFTVDTNGTTIQFWHPFGSDIEDHLQAILDMFTEETGINVELEGKGGYDNLQKAVNLGTTTNKIPQITLAYPDHMASYVENDSILRLDYYFEHDGEDFKIDDFYADYMVENQSIEQFEDKTGYYTLGVPFNKSTELMYYNSTFFDYASSIDPSIKVPSTWEEVGTVSAKILNLLEEKGLYGHILADDGNLYERASQMPSGVNMVLNFSSVKEADFHPFTYDSQANFFITTIRQWGGTYTEYDPDTLKGYLAFDSQETINGLQYMKDLHDNVRLAIPAEYGGTSKYSSGYFKNWQSLMTIGSSAGSGNSAPTGNQFKVGVAPLPYRDAEHKFAISQGTNLVLLDVGTNAQRVAAWKLMKYLGKFQNGDFAARTSYFPSCEYATNSEAYQEALIRNNPATALETPSMADALKFYVADVNQSYYMNSSENWTKFVDPGFNGSSTIRSEVGSAMGLLFMENKTPREVINELYNTLKGYTK